MAKNNSRDVKRGHHRGTGENARGKNGLGNKRAGQQQKRSRVLEALQAC